MKIHGIPIGWSPHSSPHSHGMRGERNPIPKATALDLVREAVKWGLSGVEIPYAQFPDPEDSAGLDAVIEAADEAHLFVNVAAGGYTLDRLRGPVETAARVGAQVVRTVIGGSAMGGDRRPLTGKWGAHIDEAAQGLARVMEIAENLGVRVGVENHQDVNSEDLLYIIDNVGSPLLGITFDVGNALSTVELPEHWARELAHHIVDVHIKDYKVYLTPAGYRLVRCPIGQGVVDFDAVLGEIARSGRDVPAVIELGAVEARSVPLFEPDYWDDYPPRSARHVAEVMGFVVNNARPTWEEWRTPVERGLSIEDVIAWERDEFDASLEYLRQMSDGGNAAGEDAAS